MTFLGPPPSGRQLPQVEASTDALTVYGWTGSYVMIHRNGDEVINGFPEKGALPVPPIP